MNSVVIVAVDDADQLRGFHSLLTEEPEFRGRARIIERNPSPGTLGPLTDGLQIALGSGGALVALSGIVVAWLASRPGEVTVKLTRGDNQIEITSKGVKSLTIDGIRELSTHVSQTLEAPAEEPEG